MATFTFAPCPVRARRSSADRMPVSAYIPVAMSAAEMPTRDGVSGVPVTLMTPDSAWISRSYAFFRAIGPASP